MTNFIVQFLLVGAFQHVQIRHIYCISSYSTTLSFIISAGPLASFTLPPGRAASTGSAQTNG